MYSKGHHVTEGMSTEFEKYTEIEIIEWWE